MFKEIIKKSTLTLCLFATIYTTFGQQERKYIRQGNDLYKSAIDDSGRVDSTKMKEAAELFRKAIEKAPTSYQAKYNLANANFKSKNYEAAEREYKAIQNSISHDTIQAKIYHNLGNAQLIQGKIEESIESYKNALRRNPKDIETKYNLALAQSKLNQMQNQQQNQQQEQNQEQNQDQEQNQQQEKENQNQQQEQQQSAEEKQAEEQQGQEQQMQEGEEEKDKISKEDALRILEALQNDEQKVQDKINKQNKSKSRPKSTRDW